MAAEGHVLVVDDDPDVHAMIAEYLRGHGCAVAEAADGDAMRAELARAVPDVVLLDLNLRGENGLTLARWLRERHRVGIIMVTAAGDVVDRIVGLEVGADDYVAKPFSPREVVSRVRAILRRVHAQPPAPSAPAAAFAVDGDGQRIAYHGVWLNLTRYETQLLARLLERPGRILSRSQIMESVWQDSGESLERTVDTHIKTLRGKLRAVCASEDPIVTHRGLGYSIVPPR